MADPISSTVAQGPRRRFFRPPHWGWFLLVTVVLFVGYVAASVWLPWQREQPIRRWIESWGGQIITTTGGPIWLERLVQEDRKREFKVFERVYGVDFARRRFTDRDLLRLGGLENLKMLDLGSQTVTDADLVSLSRMTNLESLSLNGTSVTDAGLVQLSQLTNLVSLSLDDTKISDSGLIRLGSLTRLQYLSVEGTLVTDKGVEELKTALRIADPVSRAPEQKVSRDQIGYLTGADGRLHPWMRDKPDNLELLDSDPKAIEENLLHGRWLVLFYSVLSGDSVRAAINSPDLARQLSGIARVAIRPTQAFEGTEKWLPDFQRYSQKGHPFWVIFEEGIAIRRYEGWMDNVAAVQFAQQ